MNSRTIWQKFKVPFLVQSILAIVVATANDAVAANINIKDTNYPIPSGAFFVSPNGKDSNSGRSANSPVSVAKAIREAPSGGTIVFRAGIYRNVSAKITKKLTLQAYPHEKAWLKGSIEVQGWVRDGNSWRKDGWTYQFPPNVGRQYLDPGYPLAAHRDMVYVNGNSLRQVSSKAQVGRGKFYVDYGSNKLFIGENPTGKSVEATTQTEGLKVNNSNSVVRGLGFAHYADRGVAVSAPSVILENNTIVWNGQSGIRLTGIQAIVRGNNISYNGRNGIWGGQTHRTLLEGNTISNNNTENFRKQWDAGGVKFIKTDGAIWRNNLVENTAGTGLWIDLSATNSIVVGNTVRNNQQNGILFEVSHKAIIASNVVYGNQPGGIAIVNSSSGRVYNNTLVSNQTNVMIGDSPRVNPNRQEIAQGITWKVRDTVVKNNIFSNTTNGSLLHNNGCKTREPSRMLVSETNNNAYYRTSSRRLPSVVTWSLGAGKCSTTYATLAAFKSATGMESNSLAIDNAPNPFFVNEAGKDFRLKSSSPANGRGAPLPSDIARAIGVASGRPVDLGALQFRAVLVQ